MTPAKRILDPTFEYVDAANTDIRVRFERIRKELADDAARLAELRAKVAPINRAKVTA